jgi:D-serine deaminase-like pyridoxal phosphate-dependent protein
MAPVDELLDRLTGFVTAADRRGLFGGDEIVLTAGGSAYFDRVVARAAELGETGRPVRVLLRSGCYLTHDHGSYERTSPLRSGAAGPALRPALELWAEVLSAPEPGRAIVGFGKRDAPFDIEFPMPLDLHRDGARAALSGRAKVIKLNDQHAFLEHDVSTQPRPGDLVTFGLSHPCTAFDKWPLIAEVDDDHTVVGAIRTVF